MTMKDYSDLISPILVKEFRQGIRSKLFTFSFMLSQFVMVLIVITGLAIGEMDQNDFNIFFWIVVILPIMFLLPLSGVNSISEEVKLKTIDLIYLTHLGSFRILLGKLLSICCQILLLLSAILPYVIVRYYIGNVNLYNDLIFLVNAYMLSVLITAICIFISTIRINVIIKWIMLFFILYFVIGMSSVFLIGPAFGALGLGSLSSTFIVYLYIIWALTILLILEFGSKLISPLTENHSTKIRIIAFTFVLLSASAEFFLNNSDEHTTINVFTLIYISLIAFVSCTEEIRDVSLVYVPFLKFKFGRLLGRIFYPGWLSGMFFTIFIFGCFISLSLYSGFMDNDFFREMNFTRVLSFLTTIIYAPIVLRFLFKNKINRIITFSFLVQLIAAIPFYFFFIGYSMGTAWHPIAAQVCAFFPTSYFLCNLTPYDEINIVFHIIGSGICIFILVIFLKDLFKAYGRIVELEKEAMIILEEQNKITENEIP
jgi:hypothetical protein